MSMSICFLIVGFVFFFFKQKTAYEMRISDWSSDVCSSDLAKTAFGLADWAADRCVGEYGIGACSVSAGLPRLSPAEARAAGAQSLVIGVANQGGVIGDAWVAVLVEAMEARLDIVSGLHTRLTSIPALVERSEEHTSELQSLMRTSYAVFCLKKTT